MSRLRILTAVSIVFLIAAAPATAPAVDRAKLVGSWTRATNSGHSEVTTFNDDGTYSFEVRDKDKVKSLASFSGKWSLSGNDIQIVISNVDGEAHEVGQSFTVKELSDEKLVFTQDDVAIALIELKRVK